jgi:hypothetical protein
MAVSGDSDTATRDYGLVLDNPHLVPPDDYRAART